MVAQRKKPFQIKKKWVKRWDGRSEVRVTN